MGCEGEKIEKQGAHEEKDTRGWELTIWIASEDYRSWKNGEEIERTATEVQEIGECERYKVLRKGKMGG